MNTQATDADRFMALVARVEAVAPEWTRLQASIVVAALLEIARDSRTFARLLGLEHALVLRDLNGLIEGGVLSLERRDERTLRTHYAPTRQAERFAGCLMTNDG